VASDDPARLCQPLVERPEIGLIIDIVCGCGKQYADAPHLLRLLRACRERPCRRRVAEQRDELAAFHHSITSSARATKGSGIVRPIAFAALTLTTSSNLVGCTTGRSPGLSPLRIRPA